MLISLHIVYGCFCATTTESSSCNKDHMTHKAQNVYYLDFYRKQQQLSTPELETCLSNFFGKSIKPL